MHSQCEQTLNAKAILYFNCTPYLYYAVLTLGLK